MHPYNHSSTVSGKRVVTPSYAVECSQTLQTTPVGILPKYGEGVYDDTGTGSLIYRLTTIVSISKTQLGEVIGKNEARCTFQDHTLLHPSGFHAS